MCTAGGQGVALRVLRGGAVVRGSGPTARCSNNLPPNSCLLHLGRCFGHSILGTPPPQAPPPPPLPPKPCIPLGRKLVTLIEFQFGDASHLKGFQLLPSNKLVTCCFTFEGGQNDIIATQCVTSIKSLVKIRCTTRKLFKIR